MCINDKTVGSYSVTGTTCVGRANFFKIDGDDPHHIGTLVSGSLTKIQQFEDDCHAIVEALAAREVQS